LRKTSKKGKVTEVITKEGEGYIHTDEVKKLANDDWFGLNGKYTTCDHEDPHFYIKAKKLKMVPDKLMVTGPANLVIADVPTPLWIPFGIFPLQKGQRSGIILPEYGETRSLGFFLRNGGYYFGISDHVDLTLQGDIYTRGSWGVRAASKYKTRYKFNGAINLKYARTRQGDPQDAGFNVRNDYRISWRHTQDSKARPNSNFSANVNFGTSTYDRTYATEANRVLNNQLNSAISFSKNFPRSPFSFSANLRHDQSLLTHKVNLQLPDMALTMNRIFPFEKKVRVGSKKWYEKIGLSWRVDARNKVSGIDSTFFTQKTFNNARYGLKHSIPVNTSFKILKHIIVEPSVKYTERWYFETVEKTWNPTIVYDIDSEGVSVIDTFYGSVITDSIKTFKAARNFNTSLRLTTKLYGIYQFKRSKIKAIRHVLTPSISFEYHPDFGDPFWGNYRSVQSDFENSQQVYSVFESVSSLYGQPGRGKVGGVRLNLNNNLEMKVFSKKDTVKNERKVKIFDALNFSTFYNFAVDSLRLSPISINGRTTLFKQINLNFSANFDPYAADSNNRRIARFEWNENHNLVRITNANISVSGGFSADQFRKKESTKGTQAELDDINRNPDNYIDYNIPWRVNTAYNLNLRFGTASNPDTVLFTQSLTIDGSIGITRNWQVQFSSGWDFVNKDITYTTVSISRNLHCWELKFRWVPYPVELSSYSIDLNVKSSILQDLKLSKKSNTRFDTGVF